MESLKDSLVQYRSTKKEHHTIIHIFEEIIRVYEYVNDYTFLKPFLPTNVENVLHVRYPKCFHEEKGSTRKSVFSQL